MRTPADAPAAWDANAGRYAAQEHLETRALATALRLAAPGREDRVVDLGCGTGALLRMLAGRSDAPGVAVGVDRSAGMLGEVGELPTGWRTLMADARSVALPDGFATVVTCAYLLHLMRPRDRAAVLGEALRLLEPGPASRLVVVSVWPNPSASGGRALRLGFRALARAWPAALGGLMPHDPHDEIEAAGLGVTRRVELPRRGYPSVVLEARLRETRGRAARR